MLEQFEQPAGMEQRLDDLQAQCKALGLTLARQNEALQQGYPPDEQLSGEVQACRSQFDALKEALQRLVEHYALPAGAGQEVHTTGDLVQLFAKIKPFLDPAGEECSATQALAAPPVDEALMLADMIGDLIRENKLEPAFWLAAYYELLHEATPPVPSLWLRMIETARQVTQHYQEGVKELAGFYSQSALAVNQEPAFQWLAFAVALLPSFHAPSSGARQVLDKLDALPQELHNLISAAVTGQPDIVQLKSLAAEAQHWLEQNRQIDQASPLAARFWVSMMEENGLIWKLLHPVRENERSQYDELSRLLKYLENEACQKKELAMQYRILLKKFRILVKNQDDQELDFFHITGSGLILSRLQEALKLARRWLTCQAVYYGNAQLDDAVSQARVKVDALAGQKQESVLMEMAVILAKHILDRFANSLKGQAPKDPATGPGKLATGNSLLLPEAGGLPAQETIGQVGKAIFNYFTAELQHGGQGGGKNEPSESKGLSNLRLDDDAGIAEYLRDFISQKEKDV